MSYGDPPETYGRNALIQQGQVGINPYGQWITPEMARTSLELMHRAAEVQEKFAHIAERAAELREQVNADRAEAEAFFEGTSWTSDARVAMQQTQNAQSALMPMQNAQSACNQYPLQYTTAQSTLNSFPPLTFKPEEWGMRVPGAQSDPYREEWRKLSDVAQQAIADMAATFDPMKHTIIGEAMAELDREDDIMSAVRDIARGG